MTGVLLITQATVPEFAEKLVSGWIEYDDYDYDDYDELNDLNAVLIVALKKCAQGDSGFIALLFGMWKAPEGGVIYALSALGTLSFIYNRQHLRNRRHLSQRVSCIFYDVQIVGFCILVFILELYICRELLHNYRSAVTDVIIFFSLVGGLDGCCSEPLLQSQFGGLQGTRGKRWGFRWGRSVIWVCLKMLGIFPMK